MLLCVLLLGLKEGKAAFDQETKDRCREKQKRGIFGWLKRMDKQAEGKKGKYAVGVRGVGKVWALEVVMVLVDVVTADRFADVEV